MASSSSTYLPAKPSTDPSLAPFLAETFVPSTYLNSVLPTPSFSSSTSQSQIQSQQQTTTTLTALSRQTQDHISTLTASLARLTATLTGLTDDILRSGARLAYEVEILRGDAAGLTDALGPGGALSEAFAHLGVDAAPAPLESSGKDDDAPPPPPPAAETNGHAQTDDLNDAQAAARDPAAPAHIRTLHDLARVRANLDRVVAVFGAAMDWPCPPADVSPAALQSYASEPATAPAATAASDKAKDSKGAPQGDGQAHAARLREEIALLLLQDDAPGSAARRRAASGARRSRDLGARAQVSGGTGEERQKGAEEGIAAAEKRIAELQALAEVWRGTAEERARVRLVDALTRMVEEERGQRKAGGA